MKLFSLLLIAASLMLTNGLHAQEQKASRTNLAEVETKWPGILFAISRLERIQDNRLLVFVRVIATSKSARSGTFLGAGRRSPPGASEDDVATDFRNRKTIFPRFGGHDRRPNAAEVSLFFRLLRRREKSIFRVNSPTIVFPEQGETLTIQFAAPPAPPPVARRRAGEADGNFSITRRQGTNNQCAGAHAFPGTIGVACGSTPPFLAANVGRRLKGFSFTEWSCFC